MNKSPTNYTCNLKLFVHMNHMILMFWVKSIAVLIGMTFPESKLWLVAWTHEHNEFPRHILGYINEDVSKSFRTGLLARELQMVQRSTTRCSCIAILWVGLVSFATIIICVAFQQVFIIIYFVIGSVRKLLDTPSYRLTCKDGVSWCSKDCVFECAFLDALGLALFH